MTKTPADEIQEAEAAIKAAAVEVADLSERLLAGDPTATAGALVAAEDELDKRQGVLAKALDFRKRRQERVAERERLDRVAALEALVAERFGRHEGDLVDLFEQAVEALTPFVEATVERNAALDSIRDELLAVEPLPDDLRIDRQGSAIHFRGHRIDNLDVKALTAEVAARALLSAGQQTSTLSTLVKEAGLANDYETHEHYGVERGALVGPSNRLRNLARTVAGDPPPPHIPRAKQLPVGYIDGDA